jgi:hypothetical protein
MTSATTFTPYLTGYPFAPRVPTKTTESFDIVRDLAIAGIEAAVFHHSARSLEEMKNDGVKPLGQSPLGLLALASTAVEWTYLTSAINKAKDSLNYHVSDQTQRSITGKTLNVFSALTAVGSIIGGISGYIGPQLAFTGLIAAYNLTWRQYS